MSSARPNQRPRPPPQGRGAPKPLDSRPVFIEITSSGPTLINTKPSSFYQCLPLAHLAGAAPGGPVGCGPATNLDS